MEITFLLAVGLLCLFLLIAFFVDYSVYGRWLSDEEIKPFLKHYLAEYHLNPMAYNILSGPFDKNFPFIAKIMIPTFCKYYIHEYGQVPRWTIAHRMITTRRAILLNEKAPVRKVPDINTL